MRWPTGRAIGGPDSPATCASIRQRLQQRILGVQGRPWEAKSIRAYDQRSLRSQRASRKVPMDTFPQQARRAGEIPVNTTRLADQRCRSVPSLRSTTDDPQVRRRHVHGLQDFHQRQGIVICKQGIRERRLRWDISAGIDNLLNPAKECVVYYIDR